MNILISGGTGFIGRNLTRTLLAKGHSVSILSRRSGHDRETGAPLIPWDAKTPDDWVHSVEKAEAVINLAGESIGAGRWTSRQKEKIFDSRIQATEAIVQAIHSVSQRPRVLISASGVDYYGHVAEAEIDESAPPGVGFLENTCVRWEETARKAEQSGVRVAIMRTGFVIGRDARAFKLMQLPFKLFAGGPFGSGKQWFSWIHILDAVEGYIFVLQNPELKGSFNLTSPNAVRVSELAKELGRALHRPSLIPAPSFALKVALGEMSDLLLNGRRAVPVRLNTAGLKFRFPVLRDALRDVLG